MLQEFKDFITKGDVVDAAVGLIMALAFIPVIGSLVQDVVMPVVGRIFGAPDFSDLKIGLGGSEEVTLENGDVVMREAAIRYGAFLNEIIAFALIAAVVFVMVKVYNRVTNTVAEDEVTEIDLLTEIRDSLKRS